MWLWTLFQNLTMQWIRNLRRHHWNIGIYTIFLTTALYVYVDECHKKRSKKISHRFHRLRSSPCGRTRIGALTSSHTTFPLRWSVFRGPRHSTLIAAKAELQDNPWNFGLFLGTLAIHQVPIFLLWWLRNPGLDTFSNSRSDKKVEVLGSRKV